MENQAARRCTAEILEEHNIAAAMSRDIQEQLEAWNAAAEAAGQAPMGQAEAAPSARTATSHSASVGRRAPAHRAKASAS